MKKVISALIVTLFAASMIAQDVTPCGTYLKDINTASIEELAKEYQRLFSYGNPYCDTTNSDFHKIMKTLASKMVTAKSTKDVIKTNMGTPYFEGTLSEYENQKVTLGRNGKPIGKQLPPQYKIPAGEYYIVYLWREKDYMVFALKADKAAASGWWEKGDY